MRRLFLFLLATSACGDRTLPPRGQLLVTIDTDAPMALPAGAILTAMDPAPLFDRLRVEVIDGAGALACDPCRTDLVLTQDLVAQGKSSIGIVLPPGRRDLRLRARLFRSIRLRADDPPADGTIDRVFELPAIGEEGIVERRAFLPLATVGVAADLSAPAAALEESLASRGQLHEGVVPAPCTVEPRPNEICVPGGAYWMGNAVHATALGGIDEPERVVVISSFLVDRAETTVRQLRASGLATRDDPVRSTGKAGGCTFTEAPSASDDLPVTCVSWALAQRFCERAGGALPTEAQLEFLASGRRSDRYVWGADPPSCQDMVHARGLATADDYVPGFSDRCSGLGNGPAVAGTGSRDRLALPGGDIVDIGGNVREWARDADETSGRCWGSGLFVDPVCAGQKDETLHARRGTAWDGIEIGARAPTRGSAAFADASTGFRCVRSGR